MKPKRIISLFFFLFSFLGGLSGILIFLVSDIRGQQHLMHGMVRLAGHKFTWIINKSVYISGFLMVVGIILYFGFVPLLKRFTQLKSPQWWKSTVEFINCKFRFLTTVGILFLGIVIGLNVWNSIEHRIESPKTPNVIIVVSDALRKDHLGCYGYDKNTSPHIDAFSKEAFVFENAYSQAPSTKPSIASLFTSQFPSQHNAVYNENSLNPQLLTLAEVLKENRYATAAFNENPMIEKRFGYNQGFDRWITNDRRHTFTFASMEDFDKRIMSWVKKHRKNPFFLYVHYIDPHNPYRAPQKEINQTDIKNNSLGKLTEGKKLAKMKNGVLIGLFKGIDKLVSLYDEEIRYIDERFGKLMAQLKQFGIMENTMVIFMADHGEGFLDHGYFYHSYSVNGELINIPLVIHFPGKIKKVLSEVPVQNIDLFPTILDTIGIDSDSFALEGESIFRKRPTEVLIFSEHLRKGYGKGMQQCVIKKNWKLIYSLEAETYSLYNLDLDPQEQANRANEYPKVVDQLKAELFSWRQYVLKKSCIASTATIDKALNRKLRSLGYVDN